MGGKRDREKIKSCAKTCSDFKARTFKICPENFLKLIEVKIQIMELQWVCIILSALNKIKIS